MLTAQAAAELRCGPLGIKHPTGASRGLSGHLPIWLLKRIQAELAESGSQKSPLTGFALRGELQDPQRSTPL